MKLSLKKRLLNVLTLLALSIGLVSPAYAAGGDTKRVSVSTDGTEGNSQATLPAISADGRYVAFESDAFNLVSEDTNVYSDIFVHDTQTGETTRVSVSAYGTEGNGPSNSPSISADGRYVAFRSDASNLVSGDTNGYNDIFVHDTQSGGTKRVSVSAYGTEGNGPTNSPSISADGRYVAFRSGATNLVSGDTNGYNDIFVHDTQSGVTKRISLASNGTEGDGSSVYPSISADGRYVVFRSSASNLVSGDTNGYYDIFVHDTQSGETKRVSVSSEGVEGNSHSAYHDPPSISADGRYVAFTSDTTNLVSEDTNVYSDIFVHDTQTGETTRVSVSANGTQGDGPSSIPSISADGRYVVFESSAPNLVNWDTNGYWDMNGYTDIFVHDTQSGWTEGVSLISLWTVGNGPSNSPSISADGRYVAFKSDATNLVSGDTNGYSDIFVHEVEIDTIAPTVTGITRANDNPTNSSSEAFTVSFSEAVTGVDFSTPFDDFHLTTTGAISGAAVTGVYIGDQTTYIVTVNTGTGDGTIRLDVVDNDSIKDGSYNPLGGPGIGNGDFTTGEAYTVTKKYTSNLGSIAAQDGWLLESGETTSKGGAMNSSATTFYLGDNAQDKQYRSILSFSTKGLPDNAEITKVTLKIRKQGTVGGGDPVIALQGFMVDIKKGFFGSGVGLQASDFQAGPDMSYGPFKPALVSGWYAINLTPAKDYINKFATKGGVTQLRLRFKLDDNNNTVANYLKLYSGNAAAASRPKLIIEYK